MFNADETRQTYINSTAVSDADDFNSLIQNLPYGTFRIYDLDVSVAGYLGLPNASNDRYTLLISRTNSGRGWVIAVPLSASAIYKRHLFQSEWTVWEGSLFSNGGG